MPIDFTKEMKKEYTIIAPDIFPTHMALFKELFNMYGYHVIIVHYEGKQVIDTGLKYLHNDMCYPAICMLGQQLYALTCGDYDPKKCALVQFQTGGGCRASNYIFLLRKALEKLNMSYVPVISISFNNFEKYSGFKITIPMAIKALRALIYGDMLLLLKNQCKPYEINKGDTEKLVSDWTNKLTLMFKKNQALTTFSMRKILKEMVESFHNIKKEKKDLIKVGIVGEIYVKYSSFGNNGLEKFLDTQNVEYMVPGVLGFFQYCFANNDVDYKYYGGKKSKKIIGNMAENLANKWEKEIEKALKNYPEFCHLMNFNLLKEKADKIIDRGVKMGEGWLLPGEIAALIEKGYNNIICTQPFGCLPNHIVAKGTIRRLRELYPSANIFPIDYDSGACKVNQENRIKLMLAIAGDKK